MTGGGEKEILRLLKKKISIRRGLVFSPCTPETFNCSERRRET